MLSCECPFEGDYDQPFWYTPEDFSEMPKFSRRKRCADKDCRRLIEPGEPVAIFERARYPQSDVEINIYGEDEPLPIADHYLCEDCAGVFFSLHELGFCFFYENTREALDEYRLIAAEAISNLKSQISNLKFQRELKNDLPGKKTVSSG